VRIKALERYMEEERKDFDIEKDKLSSALAKLPNLHSKWMRYAFGEHEKLIGLEHKARKLFREKHRYYKTEYDVQVKDNQLVWYIESDPEYSELLLKINVQKKIIEYLDAIVRKVRDQNYVIRNIIEWEQYKMGI
jgi:hypothetical protein